MSAAETAEAATASLPKLPIWHCVKAGVRGTFGNLGAFATAAALPLCLSTVIAAAVAYLGDERWGTAPQTFADLLPTALFELAWYRFLLYRSAGLRPRLLTMPDRRFAVYLGYAFLVMLLFIPTMAVPALTAFASVLPGHALAVLLAALYLAAIYLSLRFAFTFAWIATDGSGRLRESWRATRGNGLRLVIILLLIMVPYLTLIFATSALMEFVRPGFVDGLDEGTSFGPERWFLEALFQVWSYLLYGAIIAAFAEAFCIVTGWVSDNRDILERFE